MSDTTNDRLLDLLLDSWDRNNVVMTNLLRALPSGAMELRATDAGPSVSQLFTHIHYVRLVFVLEDAPEFAISVPEKEWSEEPDASRIEQMLNESAAVVRYAVKRTVDEQQEMKRHYDHPILLLQHMLWHEGYHHGRIKLILKLAGRPLLDEEAGPLTWSVWMRKKAQTPR